MADEAKKNHKANRYWVFEHTSYYPSGGMGDFRDSFNNLEEARTCSKKLTDKYCVGYIFDIDIWDEIT